MMDLHPVDILIYVINIVVLFILLRLILWKPISRFLSARAERVASEIDDAQKARLEAEALGLEYADSLAGIEAKGRDMMRESQVNAAKEAEEILTEAREKASAMIVDARERIAEEKDHAIDDAHREIARLATDLAELILKREVVPSDSMSAAEDFFQQN